MKNDVLEKPMEHVEFVDNVQFEKPKNYKIFLLNGMVDAFAVTNLLSAIFNKNRAESQGIMMQAHINGESLVEITTKEIADIKMQQVKEYIDREDPLNPEYLLGNLEFKIEEDI